MAQNPDMVSGNSDNEDEGLSGVMGLLSQQLENVAQVKIRDTAILTSQVEDSNTLQKTSSSLDDEYLKLVQPNENVAARLPKGNRITTMSGNIRAVTDPANGDTILLKQKDEYIQATQAAKHSDVQATERQYEQASSVIKKFDIGTATRGLQDLRGEALLNQIDLVNGSIDRELATERDAIRQQAAIKSGLVEAEASYNTNMMLDKQKGGIFLNQMSAQTGQALEIRDKAQISAQKYEASLVESSQRIRELMGAKETLNKRMEWRGKQDIMEANRDQNREEMAARMGTRELARFERQREWQLEKMGLENLLRQERDLEKRIGAGGPVDRMNTLIAERAQIRAAKSAALRSTVTEQNLANYHYVYGTTGSDDDDRMAIVARRDKDKTMQMILQADTTTMFEMLASEDGATRQKAYALINGSDKALNDPATKGMDSKALVAYLQNSPLSPLVGRIQTAFAASTGGFTSLKKIAQQSGIGREIVESASNDYLRESNPKGKMEIERNLTQRVIAGIVNNYMEENVTGNVLNWKTSETSEDSALGKILRGIPPTNGKVSMDDFVNTVMNTEIKNPNDNSKLMTTAEKSLLLKRAVEVAAKNSYRSMLFPANEALAAKLVGRVEQSSTLNIISRAIGMVGSRVDPNIMGIGNFGSFR